MSSKSGQQLAAAEPFSDRRAKPVVAVEVQTLLLLRDRSERVGTLYAGKTKTQRGGKDHHRQAGSARTLLGPICCKD